MAFLDWLKELFRKKEYFEIEYDDLNSFSIEFVQFSDEIGESIKNVILEFEEANVIDDSQAQLFKHSSTQYDNIESLLFEIKNITLEDYRDTYFESQGENWKFNYFITDSHGIYKEILFLSNRLTYPNNDELGDVIYPVLAIKKKDGVFYLWNLLENGSDT